jgi:hypothetical protein
MKNIMAIKNAKHIIYKYLSIYYLVVFNIYSFSYIVSFSESELYDESLSFPTSTLCYYFLYINYNLYSNL